MALLYVRNGENSMAARRNWIALYGNAHVPDLRTIRRNAREKLLTNDPQVVGFENRHQYVPKPKTVLTDAVG